RVQAEIPGVLAELYVLARLLQVAVYLRRTTYPAKCINQLDGRATHRLVHAALERGLVVEEGGAVPVNPKEAKLVEEHGGNPCILVDVEVDQVSGNLGNGRRAAGLRRSRVSRIGETDARRSVALL